MKSTLNLRIRTQLLSLLLIVSIFFQTGFITTAHAATPASVALGTATTFTDVPADYWAYQYIEALYNAGVTSGCGGSPLAYCPENPVTRAQMAVFLLRGLHGKGYFPPDAIGSVFDDVPLSAFAVNWIEQFSFEGITSGCGSGNYCPNANITRAQMAVFLLRGKYGDTYYPPAATGSVFKDVPLGHWADRWIEQLAAEGITSGCGSGKYCPDALVTRAQMAVFLVQTFDLPLNMLSPIVPDTTKALSGTTTQYLSSVSTDGSVYTFSQGTQELNALTSGDVIVGQTSSAAPDGFLRKVVSVSNNGGQTVVQTQPASIEEAIQQGEVSISEALIPSSTRQPVLADGVQPMATAAALSNKIYIKMTNVVLYDDDGNTNTTNDQIVANGSVSIEPVLNFRLKVQDFQLEELYFTMTANETSELKISSKVALAAKKEKVLATYPMNPIIFTIGVLPVTLTPTLTVVAGIDGSISASVSTGVTQKLTETAGLSYANNSWETIQQFSNEFTYNAPSLSVGLSAKAYVGAKLKVLIYGTVGPDIGLNAYLKLEANPLQTPWWKLYGGLEMPVGISVQIFSHVVAGYSAVVIDYKVVIAQAQTQPPEQYPITEDFNSSTGFTSTDPDVYISNGVVHWDVSRSEGQQYVYRDIPPFSGDVRLTVRGQVDGATNNCSVAAGIGDGIRVSGEPFNAIAVTFGYFGGGCSVQGYLVNAWGVQLVQEHFCSYTTGTWLWANSGVPYTAELTVQNGGANLSVPGLGTVSGIESYVGEYNTLFVGLTGGGDWPHCWGTIDQITVEPLP